MQSHCVLRKEIALVPFCFSFLRVYAFLLSSFPFLLVSFQEGKGGILSGEWSFR